MRFSMFLNVLLFSMFFSVNTFVLENNKDRYLYGLTKITNFKEMLAGGGNCDEDVECAYGGICKDSATHRSCACKRGLDGEYCEVVVDCVSGKYKNCKGANGSCVYATKLEEAFCSCTEFQVLDEKNHICKELRCEKKACKGGTCRVVGSREICRCPKNYILHNDACIECDCGDVKCSLDETGKPKPCICSGKMKLHYGKCRQCDCGDGECELSQNGIPKPCVCDGKLKKKQDGKCKMCDCGDGNCTLDMEGNPTPCICEGKLKKLPNGKCRLCDCGDGNCTLDMNGNPKPCICERMLKKLPNGKCRHSDCGKNGQCIIKNGRKMCKCYDKYAEKYGFCKDCDCGKGASNCTFIKREKVCVCINGYEFDINTEKCKARDACVPSPCVNGNCTRIKSKNDFLCVCDPPFTGRFCEISTCIKTKCYGGRCKIQGDVEHCICPDGFQLQNGSCTTKDVCNPNPCVNGHCTRIKRENNFICVCDSRFTGRFCEISTCIKTKCYGGRCIIQGDIESCICPDGFQLQNGSCTKSKCVPALCYGGRCEEQKDGETVCVCPKGYHLEDIGCKETICVKKNCYGGECRVTDGEEICTCREGYFLNEDVCQKKICSKPCYGGQCIIVDGKEECSCPVGFKFDGESCIKTEILKLTFDKNKRIKYVMFVIESKTNKSDMDYEHLNENEQGMII